MNRKRFLALTLSLVMAFSMVTLPSLSVLAAESEGELIVFDLRRFLYSLPNDTELQYDWPARCKVSPTGTSRRSSS